MSTTIQDDNYQNLLGLRIAARLNAAALDVPHDISERLKAARMQALGKRKVVNLQKAAGLAAQGNTAALHLGGEENGLWNRFASIMPLVALIAGLVTIGLVQEQHRASEVAEVDIQILTDDLPTDAYTDPGFAQFLLTKRQD